jgi:hypothetical protein
MQKFLIQQTMHPVMPAVAYELIEVTSGRRCGIFMSKYTACCVGEMLETAAVEIPILSAASEQRKGHANEAQA